jgi:hypothetical protein
MKVEFGENFMETAEDMPVLHNKSESKRPVKQWENEGNRTERLPITVGQV